MVSKAARPALRLFPLLVLSLVLGLVPAATASAQPTDLLISEYVEGASLDKAIELYNGTGVAVDLGLGGYRLEIYFNGSTSAGTTVTLSGVVASSDVFVIADDGAQAAILAVTDQTSTSNFWNGDDAVVLRKGGAGGPVVDSLGQVGFDPGSQWGSGDTSTQDNTLVRKVAICDPDTDPSDAFDPGMAFDGFPQGTISDLGMHTASCGGDPPPPPPPAPVVEVYEIQGAGFASTWVGQRVLTLDNVVTATAPDGFFLQTPDARADADGDTSNGVFVFTGLTGPGPGVTVGDRVDVVGTVVEFFGLTELGSPEVTLLSGGEPLPAAVALDGATPSPDQPQVAVELERLEGMRVSVAHGTVSGPNQRFGTDPLAEVHVVTGGTRAFREPGIEFPGLPGLPVWDGNPEVFELDPDKLGLPNLAIPAGSSFSAEGVIGFEFGGYELWPSALSVSEAALPVPVRLRADLEATIGSLNVFRLFDDVDDPGSEDDGQVVATLEYSTRLEKLTRYVLDVLRAPDVLAIQEAEKLDVLDDLATVISIANPSVVYTAYLVEGNDVGGIDTGYLVREDRFRVDAVTQLAAGETLSVDGSLLHDRPPLLLEGAWIVAGAELPLRVLALHQRSLSGIETESRVRQKRLEQAQSVASIVQGLQTGELGSDGGIGIAVVGDFNAFELSDGFVDVVGQIAGDFEPADNLLSGPDLVSPDFAILTETEVPAGERYSFVFQGSAQAIDHALASAALAPLVAGLEYGRGNADAALLLIDDPATPLRSSDHDGLVLFVDADPDDDGVPIGPDVCAGTAVPEGVPTIGLKPNHYALGDGDTTFDSVAAGNSGGTVYTTADTGGCSCEQVLDALSAGLGQYRFGCTAGTLNGWIAMLP
jgi:hypothetical protein